VYDFDTPVAELFEAVAAPAPVPDLAQRDIYICGPAGMMQRVLEGLRRLRVPESQIHYERFAF